MDTPEIPMKLLVNIETGVSEMVPLTDEELAQRDADRAAAEADEKVAVQAAADRDALVAKLASGTASDAETQQALAQLLGGSA